MRPKCCLRCFHLNKETTICKKGLALPIRKGSCERQKLRILARFAQFLKDNNAANGYMLQGSQNKNSKIYPVDYIISAGFAWRNSLEGEDYWHNLHCKWLGVLQDEYNID